MTQDRICENIKAHNLPIGKDQIDSILVGSQLETMSVFSQRRQMESHFNQHNYGALSEEGYKAVSEIQAKISDFNTASQAEFMSGTTNIVSNAHLGLNAQ